MTNTKNIQAWISQEQHEALTALAKRRSDLEGRKVHISELVRAGIAAILKPQQHERPFQPRIVQQQSESD